MRYDNAMKSKPQTPEYKAFEDLLGAVLSVPKAEITSGLNAVHFARCLVPGSAKLETATLTTVRRKDPGELGQRPA